MPVLARWLQHQQCRVDLQANHIAGPDRVEHIGVGRRLRRSTRRIGDLVRSDSRRFWQPDQGSRIAGVIKKLDCDQYERREANIEIEVSVIDTANGTRLFTQTYKADKVEGSIVALDAGIFGSVEKLRAFMEKTLSEVVDSALDDAALQHAMLQ